MTGTRPFFRADQVGSLLRPAALIEARERFKAGAIDHPALRGVEDVAIRDIVRRQEEIGFEVVVDGEFRRENWWIDFVAGLRGVEIRDGDVGQAFVAPASAENDDGHDHGWKYVPKNVVTTGRVHADAPITAPDFAYLRGVTAKVGKITLPSPTRSSAASTRPVATCRWKISRSARNAASPARSRATSSPRKTSGPSSAWWLRLRAPFGATHERVCAFPMPPVRDGFRPLIADISRKIRHDLPPV